MQRKGFLHADFALLDRPLQNGLLVITLCTEQGGKKDKKSRCMTEDGEEIWQGCALLSLLRD